MINIKEEQKNDIGLICYLMGLDKRTLENHLKFSYADILITEEIEIFRSLNRLRQSIFKNYSKIGKYTQLRDLGIDSIKVDVNKLRNAGIDVEEINRKSRQIVDTVNILTKEIDNRVEGVLKSTYVGNRSDILKVLFNFPIMDKGLLAKYITASNKVSMPYDLRIYRFRELDHALPYLFQSTKSLLVGCLTLIGERNIDEILKSELVMGEIAQTEEIREVEVDTEKGVYFIDCDNIDFMKFMSYMSKLDKEGKKGTKVYLYTDPMVSYLWRVTDKLVNYKNIDIVYKDVRRIKDNKSIVDIVLTVDICKEVLENGNKDICLMSSDSDFFGVITNLDANYTVVYNSDCVSRDYIEYLKLKNIRVIDIKGTEDTEVFDDIRSGIVTYLTLNMMSTIPMVRWDINSIENSIHNTIGKESEFKIDGETLRNKIDKVLSNTTIKRVEGITILKHGDREIKIGGTK